MDLASKEQKQKSEKDSEAIMGQAKRSEPTSNGSSSSDESRMAAPKLKRSKRQSASKRFPGKLHDMLSYCENERKESVISWINGGTAFEVRNPDLLKEILPIFFSHSHYSSLQRQLQIYSFKRLRDGTWSHPYFLRGKRSMCDKLDRRDFQAANTNTNTGKSTGISTGGSITVEPIPVTSWSGSKFGEHQVESKSASSAEAKVDELPVGHEGPRSPDSSRMSFSSGSSLSSMLSHIFEVNREADIGRRNNRRSMFGGEELDMFDTFEPSMIRLEPHPQYTLDQASAPSFSEQPRAQSPGFLPPSHSNDELHLPMAPAASTILNIDGAWKSNSGGTNLPLHASFDVDNANTGANTSENDGPMDVPSSSSPTPPIFLDQFTLQQEPQNAKKLQHLYREQGKKITPLQAWTATFDGMIDPLDVDSDEYDRLFD